MPIMTSVDEKKKRELKEERTQTFIKFAMDLKASFKIWAKVGGIVTGALILAYLFARFVINWDLFYEIDLKYSSIFFIVFLFFVFCVIACWFVAFFLYNTKHRRNTRYKDINTEYGGTKNA